jgi:gliding motility-associated-like protein
MKKPFPYIIRNILVLVLSLLYYPCSASHIVGGEFTYKYVGSTGSGYKYELKLTIYEDCLNAKEGVIGGDDPGLFAVYSVAGGSVPLSVDTIASAESDSVPSNFNNACITNPPRLCLLKRTFVIDYTFSPSSSGYIITYQKCCRNAAIANIANAGGTGSTYFCVIPPFRYTNNSAVFKNYPPQIICINNPLDYDNGATDADGDSLSYEFCNALVGGEDHSRPIPAAPPYDSVTWLTPTYYYTHPITGYPPIRINPVTGRITGTPNRLGRYLVTVCCHEWRHGILINTVKREFQFVVTNCSKAVVACMPQYSTDINTYIINCANYSVHFVNCSNGGTTWLWKFGVPGAPTDQSTAFEPDFTFPDTGTYSITLFVNPGSTCEDSITRLVKIYPSFAAAFSESGPQCAGDTIVFNDQSSSTLKPINYWKWNFGDGDSSFLQNPTHRFLYGGTYKVTLVSENARDCVDTALNQVVIENFQPFAGNDTIIVKGEKVQFNASGGDAYTWRPATNLNDTVISNPLGFYPDTGRFTYYVHVKSEFGCSGYDTIKVIVVGQAEFFMPNAFTPNGDGKNDIFRPIAVGYSGLKYFRIFNRFGQVVYDKTTLDGGWDGTFNNKLCDLGTYYWEIFFTDRYGKDSFLKGDVTLIR